MTPREELQLLVDNVLVDGRGVDDAVHQAYLVGLEAARSVLGEPSVYRIVTEDGELISRRFQSKMKRFYPNVGDAKRALQFAPKGAKVQAGRVEWEDVT